MGRVRGLTLVISRGGAICLTRIGTAFRTRMAIRGLREPPNIPRMPPRTISSGALLLNVQPCLDCSRCAHPLSGALGNAPAELIIGEGADCSQGRSFGLSHVSRDVSRGRLCGEAFQQHSCFGFGADCGNLQDRSAVAGFDEASLVIHSAASKWAGHDEVSGAHSWR
jgi:hypothetical protein